MNRAFSFILGLFFLTEGIWGLFSPVVLGVLTTNIAHAIIHIVLGFCGLTWGYGKKPKAYCTGIGLLLLVVGIFYFIPATGALLVELLNVNREVAYVNICIGILSLLVAQVGSKRVVAH